MNYQYPVSPYVQTTMAQAMNSIMTGGPLPPNCFVVALPMQQAQQMFPQLMMNYASGGSAMVYSPPASYYGQLYQPQIPQYSMNQQSTALVPYSNHYAQGYGQNYNYPVVPYLEYKGKSKKKNRHGKRNPAEPHSNIYNSSSFDTEMENLSWSRLFDRHNHRHHHRHANKPNKDQNALDYDKKDRSSKDQQNNLGKPITISTLSSSSSTTSDETIRRVTVSSKPSSEISLPKQQIKGSLPFKYSSEFVPGTGKQKLQKSHKKDLKVKPDDVFIVKKTQPSQQSTQK